jgi:DNA-binding NarL/FixJ family response regulator
VIRVFIADDHAVVRSGLQLVLEATGEMVVVGTAADGLSAVQAGEIDRCDVVLLDLSLPRMNGSEVLRRLRARRPELPVVILSMYAEDQYALHLLREGAAAYLSKNRAPEEVVAAIRKVVRGGTYVTDTLAGHALHAPSGGAGLPHTRLSPREHEVLLLLVQGRSVSEIAAEMNLGLSTVSNHLRRIKDKLAVTTTAELIGYAHRAGVLR